MQIFFYLSIILNENEYLTSYQKNKMNKILSYTVS